MHNSMCSFVVTFLDMVMIIKTSANTGNTWWNCCLCGSVEMCVFSVNNDENKNCDWLY